MGEKTPDTDESGIERRDILKGLGFGAVGLAGVGAMSGNVAAAGSVVNVGFTPPDEDLEDDEIIPSVSMAETGHEHLPGTAGTADTPTLRPDITDGTYDLVVKTNMDTPDKTFLVGKSYTVLSSGRSARPSPPGGNVKIGPDLQVSKAVFEEGTMSGSTEDVMTDTDGIAEIRQNFSVEELNSGEHIMVLTCTNYNSLGGASPRTGGSKKFMEGTYQFNVGENVAVVAHGFNVP